MTMEARKRRAKSMERAVQCHKVRQTAFYGRLRGRRGNRMKKRNEVKA